MQGFMRSRLRIVYSRVVGVSRGLLAGAKGVVGGLYYHDCLGLSAQVAYSVLFSLFPFLLIVNAVVSFVPGGQEAVGHWLLGGLAGLVSTDSRLYEIVKQDVLGEAGALSATLLSLGVVLTLWSASSAIMVLLKAVNRAYGLEETRSWQKRRVMAIVWSIAGAVVIPAGVFLLVFGSWVGDRIGQEAGFDSGWHTLWVGLRWPVVFVLLVGALGLFLYLAPSRRQRWYTVVPGALFSVAAIIGVSAALSWFVSQSVMQVRWLTYGAIGTVIVLLFWAFLVALVVLVGGEINAAVHRAIVTRKGRRDDLVESQHDE
jgi:membrane protein